MNNEEQLRQHLIEHKKIIHDASSEDEEDEEEEEDEGEMPEDLLDLPH